MDKSCFQKQPLFFRDIKATGEVYTLVTFSITFLIFLKC
uniref:Uncharacterized protein n=1 Tax=Anguilla anguilla TaxID=7936 RepID=A0A0E9UTZ6_ANGAN